MGSRRWLPLALVALASLCLAAPAGAATFQVTTSEDLEDPTPDGTCGSCSLREAVSEAGFLASDDTIRLQPAAYELTAGELTVDAGAGELTVDGISAPLTAIDGGGLDRVFRVVSTASLDLRSLTIRNGKATNESGGGIESAGDLSLTDVAVSGNEARNGGGIATNGTLSLTHSTVSGNEAGVSGAGIDARAFGSALPATVRLVNSTVSQNNADGPGAGIDNSGGSVTLLNSTIASNDGGSANGRGLDLESATATVTNSVLADNVDGDCRVVSGGAIVSQGGNVASDPSCGFGRALDPRLAPLADNGGETRTHALRAGSAAIDAAAGPGCPASDQRGVSRPQGRACDSGSFEAQTGPRSPDDTVAPALTGLSATNRVFRVNPRGRAAARSRTKKGTRFRYRLSEAAGVSFAIGRRTRGRLVGERCRRETARNRGRPRCVRWTSVWRFVRAGVAGANRTSFSGRVRPGRKARSLKPGRYRASVRATDAAGNRSKLSRVSFRIVR